MKTKPLTIIASIVLVLATIAGASALAGIHIESYGPGMDILGSGYSGAGGLFDSNSITSVSFYGPGQSGGVYYNGPAGYQFGGYNYGNSGYSYGIVDGQLSNFNARNVYGVTGGIYHAGGGYGMNYYGNINVGHNIPYTYYPTVNSYGNVPTPYWGYNYGIDRTGSSWY